MRNDFNVTQVMNGRTRIWIHSSLTPEIIFLCLQESNHQDEKRTMSGDGRSLPGKHSSVIHNVTLTHTH